MAAVSAPKYACAGCGKRTERPVRCPLCNWFYYCCNQHLEDHKLTHQPDCKAFRLLTAGNRGWVRTEPSERLFDSSGGSGGSGQVQSEGSEYPTCYPDDGDIVILHWQVQMITGKILHTSYPAGVGCIRQAVARCSPRPLCLGRGTWIPGAESALKFINNGELATFYVASDQAYSENGIPMGNSYLIPAKMPLKCTVAVLDVLRRSQPGVPPAVPKIPQRPLSVPFPPVRDAEDESQSPESPPRSQQYGFMFVDDQPPVA